MLKDILNGLSSACIEKKIQIATAESCTGGLVSKLITDCAGSSQWFERGFVTYSNLAKVQMLCVGTKLLEEQGAVSEAVALAMAEGALTHSQALYSLSITGVAGPGGGSESKPVGTVCFAWAYWNENKVSISAISTTKQFSGDRDSIRNQSAIYSLQQLYQLIV